MGEIISTKNTSDKKTIIKIKMELEELNNLKGHLKNINLFNPEECDKKSEINLRGNGGVTKYFKIPLSLRTKKKYSGILKCQKVQTPSKDFYIYTIEK